MTNAMATFARKNPGDVGNAGRLASSDHGPSGVDEEKLKAEFKEGMLLVHLPKTEKAKTKAIEVKVE